MKFTHTPDSGITLIIYMGYLIATSKPELNIEKQTQPTFIQGFLMQWLNPKAWMACVSGVTLFSAPNDNYVFLTFSLIYFVVCYLSLFSWSVLGDKVTVVLNTELRIRVFNLIMGGLLLITASYLLYIQLLK